MFVCVWCAESVDRWRFAEKIISTNHHRAAHKRLANRSARICIRTFTPILSRFSATS
ncbi:unnamed protein product [Acanthoscelides obtectus]|uniref:Uncharacterized protein n=1 Tax=Acanthoscelides obtectus TaxID=200917 RepID=A0A9P0JHN0_ACAOB|nr:unnamed protein product [Acanthoscelides obtectus]CAK1661484.1 hypothetical protein AOBTE_LOCUS22649 [Acanthoscelides obtectus]